MDRFTVEARPVISSTTGEQVATNYYGYDTATGKLATSSCVGTPEAAAQLVATLNRPWKNRAWK